MRRLPRWPRLYGHPAGDTAIVLLAGLVVLLLGVIGARALFGAAGPTAVAMSRGRSLAALPPLGWNPQALWSTPALLKGAGRILVDGGVVAMVTAERQVVLVELASGRVLWQRSLPAGTLRTALTSTAVAGREVVAVHLDGRLAWWDLDTGQEGGLDLPAGARVGFSGDAPLVGLDRTTVGVLDSGGALRRIPVPSGATALAARADGTVTAVAPAGWWHLVPGSAAGPARRLPAPDPGQVGTPTVVSYLSGHLVTLWPGHRRGVRELAVFSDRDRLRYAFSGPAVEPAPSAPAPSGNPATSGNPAPATSGNPATLSWHPSPSGTWGILGRTLVDIREGRVRDLGGWTTRHIAQDRALGYLDGAAVVAGPDLPRGLLRPGESFPEAVTSAGVAVRAAEAGAEVVHLLPWSGIAQSPSETPRAPVRFPREPATGTGRGRSALAR